MVYNGYTVKKGGEARCPAVANQINDAKLTRVLRSEPWNRIAPLFFRIQALLRSTQIKSVFTQK